MFGLGTFEIVVIVFFILVFYGPEQLPRLAKRAAYFFRHIKIISEEVSRAVKREVENLEKMAELEELKKNPNAQAEKIIAATTAESKSLPEEAEKEEPLPK